MVEDYDIDTDDAADLVVLLEVVDGLEDFLALLETEGIPFVRLIEGEGADSILD